MKLLESYKALLAEVKADCHNPSVNEVFNFYNDMMYDLDTIMELLEQIGLESDEVLDLIAEVRDDHSNSIASHLKLYW